MKKIYINENQISKELLLPKFIFQAVKAHETSLGDNPAFPGEDRYPFDYRIIKERFNEVCASMKNIGIDTTDINALISALSDLVTECKKIEKPIRPQLEKICYNAVNRLFAIPDETIDLTCKLVDKVTYKTSIGVTPEDNVGATYKFKDLDDIELSKAAVSKRRFINSLIMGASEIYSNMIELYADDINKINPSLLGIYDKIMTINNYILFMTEENVSDDKPKQGSYVEVHIGNGYDSATVIEAKGVIFPLLLHDTIKGLFELFSIHGLPHDREKAKYVVGKSDFILAEPWDMRFGAKLWEKIFGGITDTNIIPYLFMNLIQLQGDEFNLAMKEMLAGTEKGEQIFGDAVKAASDNYGYQEFKNRIDAKNVDKSVISDSFFTAAELDGLDIDGDDNGNVIEEDDVSELSHNTYQSAANIAFDREDDPRVRDFRKQAEKNWIHDNNYPQSVGDYKNDEHWIDLNNGKKLVIFDDEYQSLNDLVNGVKMGKLLIHARGMAGEITDNKRYIEPCFSETMMEFYGGDYEEMARSKSEYYGEEIEPEYPELIFASDNFSWCNDTRNGVFFIKSDGFQKSLGDGMIQLPNGRICKYWEGDVYDYDNENFREEPWGVEYGDWYSSNYAEVVAVMNINENGEVNESRITESIENQDSPLYHYTFLKFLVEMLETGKFETSNNDIDYDRAEKYDEGWSISSDRNRPYISFTRDKGYNVNMDKRSWGGDESLGSQVRIKFSPSFFKGLRNATLRPYDYNHFNSSMYNYPDQKEEKLFFNKQIESIPFDGSCIEKVDILTREKTFDSDIPLLKRLQQFPDVVEKTIVYFIDYAVSQSIINKTSGDVLKNDDYQKYSKFLTDDERYAIPLADMINNKE